MARVILASAGIETGPGEDDKPCDEAQQDACRNEVGAENLEWSCQHCNRRPKVS